jgi:hypothetical protein
MINQNKRKWIILKVDLIIRKQMSSVIGN